MTTRTVTGTMRHLDGTAWVGLKLQFDLLADVDSGGALVPVETHIEKTNSVGAFSIALTVPDTGTANYRLTIPDAISGLYSRTNDVSTYDFYLGSGSPISLDTLLAIPAVQVTASSLQTLIDTFNVTTFATKTSAYTIQEGDEVILANGSFSITLPDATGSGLTHVVKNIGSGAIVVEPTAGTIDGAASVSLSQYDVISVLDAAVDVWYVL